MPSADDNWIKFLLSTAVGYLGTQIANIFSSSRIGYRYLQGTAPGTALPGQPGENSPGTCVNCTVPGIPGIGGQSGAPGIAGSKGVCIQNGVQVPCGFYYYYG